MNSSPQAGVPFMVPRLLLRRDTSATCNGKLTRMYPRTCVQPLMIDSGQTDCRGNARTGAEGLSAIAGHARNTCPALPRSPSAP
jgi:hypothetical protein